MLNLLVIKNIQIEYLTKSYKSLNNKLNKINKNKNDLYHIENQVNKGKLLKEETENKILNLDFKINKAIYHKIYSLNIIIIILKIELLHFV
jgi:hypothetical protein